MYLNVRSFSFSDYAIVCIILGTVIFAGFMQGIGVGIILTVLLFVLRYSRISAIQGQHSLLEHRSTVERSSASKRALNRPVHCRKRIALGLYPGERRRGQAGEKIQAGLADRGPLRLLAQ